ncbi:MAG TPA: outer membrane beta-barrel protein [Chthoniobacteraceae bacterium]|nr:outer membrane beta-barrel protein [Chthoniobacteraceae bacterium]
MLALGALRAQTPAAPSQTADSSADQSGAQGPADDDAASLTPDAAPAQMAPPTTPEEEQTFENSYYGADTSDQAAPAGSGAQSRPWKLNLHASVGSTYDDNIFISDTDRQSDLITLITGGGGLTLGDYTTKQGSYLTADYTGIGEIFARHTDQDAYEQNALLDGQALLGRLTIKGGFQFEDLADENIDIGARVQSRIYTGNLDVRCDISDKTFLDLTAQLTDADYDLYVDSNDERGGLSLNYRPDPVLTLGLGAMGGVLNVEDAGSQTYEQGLVSAAADLTGKFTLKASGGVEGRQYPDGGGHTTPVWELTADYQPFAAVDIHLTGYRRVMNSALYTGYDYAATGFDAGVEYTLSPCFGLLLNGGYENTDYLNITGGASLSRSDDYYFVQPGVRYTASSYCTVDLNYMHRENASSQKSFSFTNNQVGLTVNFKF